MEIFLDTANQQEIEKWLNQGVLDGVTTNPTILRREGYRDLESGAKQIARLVYPRPVSVEVFSTDFNEMAEQARAFARWADNIVVKITVITEEGEPCLGVIRQLASEGIPINCTACLSFGQAMLAAKAGARYVSLFIGRINDEGNDGAQVVRHTREWLDRWGLPTRIIVGSVRTTLDVQNAALAGAHVVTVPPDILKRLVDHKYSRITVQQFVADGRKAFGGVAQQV